MHNSHTIIRIEGMMIDMNMCLRFAEVKEKYIDDGDGYSRTDLGT